MIKKKTSENHSKGAILSNKRKGSGCHLEDHLKRQFRRHPEAKEKLLFKGKYTSASFKRVCFTFDYSVKSIHSRSFD